MSHAKKFRIVILSRTFAKSTRKPLDYLEEQGIEYELKRNDKPEDEGEIAKLIGDADGVIVGSDKIGSYVFDKCKNLKVVSKHGVGIDNINLQEAKIRNVSVTVTQNMNSESVADLTWLFILGTSRNILNKAMNSDNAEQRWGDTFLGHEAYEKTLGIIGYGAIGRGVAQRASGFRNEVLVYDPMIQDFDEGLNIRKVELPELYSKSDIISLHAPLLPQTKYMINRDTIDLMKDGVIIINTSRGQLIDESALYEALKSGKVKAAGLDVFSEEPPNGNPLLGLDNVIATPHIGAHSVEANYRMGMSAAENVVKALLNYHELATEQ